MKNLKHSILILAVFLSLPVFSQTETGMIMLGGNTGFSAVSANNNNGTAYYSLGKSESKIVEFTPEMGFFIARNFAAGLAVRYTSEKEKSGLNTVSSSSLSAIPFVRFYIGKQPIKPFIYGGAGVGKANTNATGFGSAAVIDQRLSTWEIGGGFAVFMNNSVSMEFGGAYSSVTSKYSTPSVNDNVDKLTGFGFKIGIVVYL